MGGRYLPILRTRTTEIASVLNGGADDIAAFLADARTAADVATYFDNSVTSAGHLDSAVRPLSQVLRDVAVVGSGFCRGWHPGSPKARSRRRRSSRKPFRTGSSRRGRPDSPRCQVVAAHRSGLLAGVVGGEGPRVGVSVAAGGSEGGCGGGVVGAGGDQGVQEDAGFEWVEEPGADEAVVE